MRKTVIFVHPSLDLFDSLYAARKAGQLAGATGQLRGENPHPCECHRAQWERGWQEGEALFSRTRSVVVLPVVR